VAPVEHVEARVRQALQAGGDTGIVVIDFDPVRREGVADPLEERVGELLVVVLADEADDVIQQEKTLDRVANRLGLRLELVDDQGGADI
jgi:hypothetical protein